jgi:hypothetical protein
VPGPVAIAGELDNEEAVAYLGLRNFIDGLMADRKELRREGEIVVARLYYAL